MTQLSKPLGERLIASVRQRLATHGLRPGCCYQISQTAKTKLYSKTRRGKSIFVGCYPSKERVGRSWRAQARLPGHDKPFFIGQFTTELEAAVAHDQVMLVTQAHYCRSVNFTDEMRAFLEAQLARDPFSTRIRGVDLVPPPEDMAVAAQNSTAWAIEQKFDPGSAAASGSGAASSGSSSSRRAAATGEAAAARASRSRP